MLKTNNIDIKARNSALIKLMNSFMSGESEEIFKNKLSDEEIEFVNKNLYEEDVKIFDIILCNGEPNLPNGFSHYVNFSRVLYNIRKYNTNRKINNLCIFRCINEKINHMHIMFGFDDLPFLNNIFKYDDESYLRALAYACEKEDIETIISLLDQIYSFKTMLKAYKCLSYFKTYNFKIISLYLFLNLLSFNYEEIHHTKAKEFIELHKFFNELEIDEENAQLFSLLIKEINNKILKYLESKYNNF